MTPAEYLEEKLRTCSNHILTEIEKKDIADNGLNNFIFKKACSKKFRKWKISNEAKSQISEAINMKAKNNEPIEFTIGFGGYKLWRLPSTPEVDWAEFFTLAYFSEYLAPIAAAYKPGIHLTFADDDAIIEQMNNVPKKDTEIYFQSFKILLDKFSKYWPDNFKINLVKTKSLYGEKYDKALKDNIEKISKDFDKRDINQINELKKQANQNIQWDGKNDWTSLSEKEKDNKLDKSLILHEAHCSLPKKIEFIEGNDKVYLTTFQESGSIAIGTTKSCAAKFWTGYGVLEQREEKFYDIILTPPQLDKRKEEVYDIEKTDFIPLTNFQQIKIYKKK